MAYKLFSNETPLNLVLSGVCVGGGVSIDSSNKFTSFFPYKLYPILCLFHF